MAKFQDLTGQRYGRLIVVERTNNNKYGDAMWVCQCDCGNIIVVRGCDLRKGTTQSCKCLQKELSAKRKTTHGLSKTRLHKIWLKMIERCHNPNHTHYHNYGGRGINVCDEWLNGFLSFYAWSMSHGYAENLTLDRIDNNKGYLPDNCRWVDMVMQQNNKSTNHLITINGTTKNVTQWCIVLGVSRAKVYKRLKRGWSIEKVFEL